MRKLNISGTKSISKASRLQKKVLFLIEVMLHGHDRITVAI